MFDLHIDPCFGYTSVAVSARYDAGADAVRRAASLFERLCLQARLRCFWGALWGRPRALQDLEQVRRRMRVAGACDEGIREVPLDRIVGSEGRVKDFDAGFLPLQMRSRDRWVSVAAAVWTDVPLPPVSLIRVGAYYFVRDGHHRISVARVMGQQYVEAEVVCWEPAEAAAPAEAPAPAGARLAWVT